MRYINSRFTYLLTYLLKAVVKVSVSQLTWLQGVESKSPWRTPTLGIVKSPQPWKCCTVKSFERNIHYARNVFCMPAVFQKLCRWLSNCPAVGDPGTGTSQLTWQLPLTSASPQNPQMAHGPLVMEVPKLESESKSSKNLGLHIAAWLANVLVTERTHIAMLYLLDANHCHKHTTDTTNEYKCS